MASACCSAVNLAADTALVKDICRTFCARPPSSWALIDRVGWIRALSGAHLKAISY